MIHEEWVLGECDWGECEEQAVGWRWDPQVSMWLPVCPRHMTGGPEPWGTRIPPTMSPRR